MPAIQDGRIPGTYRWTLVVPKLGTLRLQYLYVLATGAEQ